MIAFVRGNVVSKTFDCVILDVAGVGYKIVMSAQSATKIPEIGTEIQLLTKMVVKDDGIMLYGFDSSLEQEVFEKLITVSGIGPKAALSILSSYTAEEVIEIIASQDAARMQKASGVGKKTASRILLELKEAFSQQEESLFTQGSPSQKSTALQSAAEALLSMGFTSAEVDLALKGAPAEGNESSLLQYALKRLGE